MNSALNTYQIQQIKNASPTELIGILYDMAIQATYRKDQVRLIKILSLLMRSLNHDYEVAENFFNLYEYCQHVARDNKFDEVRDLLSGIRDAWYETVIKGNKTVLNAAV
jgi:flagellin-specific chaperone FliS